ncbi:MAG: hypothetical protein AAB666_01945, partial [Patescibacteria group bacterium]
MPRQKIKKQTAKKIDFPTMFYREAPIEKIMANTAKASAPIMSSFHKAKEGTPTMGGILIWVTALFLALLVFYFGELTNIDILKKL